MCVLVGTEDSSDEEDAWGAAAAAPAAVPTDLSDEAMLNDDAELAAMAARHTAEEAGYHALPMEPPGDDDDLSPEALVAARQVTFIAGGAGRAPTVVVDRAVAMADRTLARARPAATKEARRGRGHSRWLRRRALTHRRGVAHPVGHGLVQAPRPRCAGVGTHAAGERLDADARLLGRAPAARARALVLGRSRGAVKGRGARGKGQGAGGVGVGACTGWLRPFCI